MNISKLKIKALRLGLFAFAIMLISYSEALSVYPNGGNDNVLRIQGGSALIAWEKDMLSDTVKIKLWNAETFSFTVLENQYVDTSGVYVWEIDSNFTAGSKYLLFVEKYDSPDIYIRSAAYFSVQGIQAKRSLGPKQQPTVTKTLEIYPIPASDHIVILLNGDEAVGDIELYDNLGNMVLTKQNINSNYYNLFLENKSAGTYFIKIKSTKNKTYSEKVVIH